MLTKYKGVRPKKDVKSSFKMFSCSEAYSEIFSERGHQNLTYFKHRFFRLNYFEAS